jgi:hypothetical protein
MIKKTPNVLGAFTIVVWSFEHLYICKQQLWFFKKKSGYFKIKEPQVLIILIIPNN